MCVPHYPAIRVVRGEWEAAYDEAAADHMIETKMHEEETCEPEGGYVEDAGNSWGDDNEAYEAEPWEPEGGYDESAGDNRYDDDGQESQAEDGGGWVDEEWADETEDHG